MQGIKKSLIPQKAFEIFKIVEQSYKDRKSISNEELLKLYSYFGEPLTEATEILEKCKIIQYATRDLCRVVFELSTSQEHDKVLDGQEAITCKHVLAICLAKITGKVRKETLEQDVFQQYLNSQLVAYLGIESQEID